MTRTTLPISAPRTTRLLRGATLGALTASALIVSATGCLDRPLAPATPKTNNVLSDSVKESSVDKIDILFMIDNSASMADKQIVLARAIPDLVGRLVTPLCGTTDMNGKFTAAPKAEQPGADPTDPTKLLPCGMGQVREFTSIIDIHIGVVSSSLGDHGSDTCHFNSANMLQSGNNVTLNDQAHLLKRSPRASQTDYGFTQANVQTYGDEGFLAWDPSQKKNIPPGESNVGNLTNNFTSIVQGADQAGCGYEAQMEAWYRFLIEPNPPNVVNHARGASGKVDFGQAATADDTDTALLQQRTDFLRPDSLVAIISLSDENDCSIIDGTMPADVCNHPTYDKATGLATGCSQGREAWPDTYNAQLNFNGGQPFPANWLVAQLAIPENVPYSLPPGINYYHMLPGTSACDNDWASPDCKSCLNNDVAQSDPKCAKAFNPSSAPTDDDDPILLRLWETKRRFGVDFLYPLQRYIDGLKNQQVYDRNGYLVQNPLFDDLQYAQMTANGGKPTRPKSAARPSNLVFYAAIAGVPWQDLARDPKDLSKGYKPAFSADPADPGLNDVIMGVTNKDGSPATGWDLILGDPFNPNLKDPMTGKTARRDPVDPLMKESNKPRFSDMAPATHPITGDKLADSWNNINGNEYVAAKVTVAGSQTQDLEYACIFPLPQDLPPKDCKANMAMQLPCDCSDWDPAKSKNPLCATPVDPNNRAVGKYGTYETNQYRAKAYPGTRYLHVLKGIGEQAIVASICASNLSNQDAGDYGYRPAVAAIIERLKTQLGGKCLPRKLQPNGDGTTPCLIIDAKMPKPAKAGDPNPFTKADIDACNKCAEPAREPLNTAAHPVDASTLVGDVTNFQCKCVVKQYGEGAKDPTKDPNFVACTTAPDPLSLDQGGWCYVDPSSSTGATQKAQQDLVAKCPSTEQQKIRFVNAGTDNANLFITCLGAASGQASGAAGAAAK